MKESVYMVDFSKLIKGSSDEEIEKIFSRKEKREEKEDRRKVVSKNIKKDLNRKESY